MYTPSCFLLSLLRHPLNFSYTACKKTRLLFLPAQNLTGKALFSYPWSPIFQNNLTQFLSGLSMNMRQREMAEYLSVNRSALSRTLTDMKKDGLILWNRNHFLLLYRSLSL